MALLLFMLFSACQKVSLHVFQNRLSADVDSSFSEDLLNSRPDLLHLAGGGVVLALALDVVL